VQPVWRADRPQKGRYREFYQCDADVVGSNSLLNEVEFVNLYADVFTRLGIQGCELRINSRKILSALAEVCGGAEKLTDITIAIDKLDKIGLEKVKEELLQRGLSGAQVSIIEKYLDINGSNESKMASIKELLMDSENGKKGISELEYILTMINDQRSKDGNDEKSESTSLIIDFTLARGLNYYTGIIFEAKAPSTVKIGSIGGGGRYDDLTGLFGVPNIPGAGISFGVDRIYDVMEELQLFPSKVEQGTKVLFFNTGFEESKKAYELLVDLRKSGIAAELFHEQAKFDKQFKYAEKKQIPFIIIIGSKELEEKSFVIKDLRSGEQRSVPFGDMASLSFN
jgi:histidyl-tRNA synthetase